MKFEAGKPATIMQTVSTENGYSDTQEPIKTCVVKRVMKKFIELDDGTKWSHDGKEYPKRKGFHFRRPWVVPGTTADIERRALANQKRQELPRYVDWSGLRRLSDDAVLEIAAIVKREQEKVAR